MIPVLVTRGASQALPVFVRYGAMAVQFLAVAAVARHLDSASAGMYLSLAGVVQASFFVAGLGIPDGLVRTTTALRARGCEDQAVGLLRRGVLTSLATVFPLAVAAGFVGGALTSDLVLGFLFGAWWGAYGVIFSLAQALMASRREGLGTFVFYAAVNCGLLISLVPALLLGLATTLTQAMVFTVGGAWMAAAALLPTLMALIRQPPRRHTKDSLRPSLLMGIPAAANRVSQALLIWSPVWVAAVVLDPEAAVIVAVASRLAGVVGAALAAVNFSIRPALVADAARGDATSLAHRLRRVSCIATALVLIAALLNLLSGRAVISALFGEGFSDSSLALSLLLVASFGDAIAGASSELVKMVGNPMWLLQLQLLAIAVTFPIQVATAYAFNLWAQLSVFGGMVLIFNLVVLFKARRLILAVRGAS